MRIHGMSIPTSADLQVALDPAAKAPTGTAAAAGEKTETAGEKAGSTVACAGSSTEATGQPGGTSTLARAGQASGATQASRSEPPRQLQDSLQLTFGPHCGPSVARNTEVHDSPEIKFHARPPGGSEEWGHIRGHAELRCQKTGTITDA
jgi:hypothetical protein